MSAGRCIGGVCISRHDLTTRPGWRRLAGCCCRTGLWCSRRDSAFSPSTGTGPLTRWSSCSGEDYRNLDRGRLVGSDGGQSLPPLPRLFLRQGNKHQSRKLQSPHEGRQSNTLACRTAARSAECNVSQCGWAGQYTHLCKAVALQPAGFFCLSFRLLLSTQSCCFGFSCSPLLGEPFVFPLLRQDSALACLPAPVYTARDDAL